MLAGIRGEGASSKEGPRYAGIRTSASALGPRRTGCRLSENLTEGARDQTSRHRVRGEDLALTSAPATYTWVVFGGVTLARKKVINLLKADSVMERRTTRTAWPVRSLSARRCMEMEKVLTLS